MAGIKMRIKVYFWACYLFVVGNSFIMGDVRKNPPYSVFSQVAGSVGIFQSEHNGRIPTGWNELIAEGYLKDQLLHAARKHLELERRYGFFEKPIKIDAGGRQLDLIALAVETGKEGDKTVRHSDGNSHITPGRMAIILAPGYEFATNTHFTENQLRRIFSTAGLDLSDYTGIEGNWANKEELRTASVRVPDAIPEEVERDEDQATQKNSARNREKNNILTKQSKDIVHSRQWYWYGVITLMLVSFSCIVLTANRKKNPKKTRRPQ